MNLVSQQTEDMIQQAEWLHNIPPEVRHYVEDTLRDSIGYEMHTLKPLDINVCILATLTWVPITGWWIYTYTSVFNSLEEYNYVFRYSHQDSEIELDPNQLMVFRKHPSMSTFDTRRLECIGLTKIEQGQIFGFIRETICQQLEMDPPDSQLIIDTVWATLMWVLDEVMSGEWLSSFDPVYSTADVFWAAFLKRWSSGGDVPWHTLPTGKYDTWGSDDKEHLDFHLKNFIQVQSPHLASLLSGESSLSLVSGFLLRLLDETRDSDVEEEYEEAKYNEVNLILEHYSELEIGVVTPEVLDYLRQYESSMSLMNPEVMIRDDRSPGSCKMCSTAKWCVERYVEGETSSHTFLCKGCTSIIEENSNTYTDPFRRTPREKFCNSCRNTECEFNESTVDEFGNAIPTFMIRDGERRLENYKQYILEGPKGMLGQLTKEDINNHFVGRTLPDYGESDEADTNW